MSNVTDFPARPRAADKLVLGGSTSIIPASTAEVAKIADMVARSPAIVTTVTARDWEAIDRLPSDRQEIARKRLWQRKLAEIVQKVMEGLELGIPPMTAIRQLYVIDGRVGMYVELMRSLVLRAGAGHVLRKVEDTQVSVTWLGVRGDDPEHAMLSRWTIGAQPAFGYDFRGRELSIVGVDASKKLISTWGQKRGERVKAPITTKDNWQANPGRMLSARACGDLCRDMFPDVLQGVALVQELDDERQGRTTWTSSDGEVIDADTGEVLSPGAAGEIEREPDPDPSGDQVPF